MSTIRLTAAQALVRYLGAQVNEDGEALVAGVWAIFGHGNVAGWHSLNLLERSVADEIAAIEPQLDVLTALGCSVFIACDTTGGISGKIDAPISTRPILNSGSWPAFCADVEAVAARHGYSGWLITEAEQDPTVRDPVVYQTLALKTLRAMAWDAGLDKEGVN